MSTNQANLNKMCPSAGAAKLGDLFVSLIGTINALTAKVNELETSYAAHTHHCDGSQAGAYSCSTPTTDAATVTGGTAVALTHTADVQQLAALN